MYRAEASRRPLTPPAPHTPEPQADNAFPSSSSPNASRDRRKRGTVDDVSLSRRTVSARRVQPAPISPPLMPPPQPVGGRVAYPLTETPRHPGHAVCSSTGGEGASGGVELRGSFGRDFIFNVLGIFFPEPRAGNQSTGKPSSA